MRGMKTGNARNRKPTKLSYRASACRRRQSIYDKRRKDPASFTV